jgi:HPt (histidine-containing phosphotransfer) domain-containing protein
MVTTPEELQNRIAQIAVRYLDRVTKELEQLRTLIDAAAGGNLQPVRDIEVLAHRMHGSGAMLRFDEISGSASDLERMAAEFLRAGQADQPQMIVVLQRLQAAVEKAVAARRAETSS